MPRTAAGLKIRESRRAMGLRQNELARRVGISASYLNLIERDRRSIGGTLLAAIGRELGLSVDELDGSTERRLRDQLATLAEDPAIGAEELRAGSADAFIARHPAWARGAARAYAAFRSAEAEAEVMSDRLAHDTVLSDAVHAMLTEITALRSTVEILADPRELEPEQRARFEGIVDEQSRRLVGTGRALAAHFDQMTEGRRPRTAVEDAEEFLHRSAASAAIERAGRRLRETLVSGGRDLERALVAAVSAGAPAIPADWGRVRRVAALALAYARQAAVPEIEAAMTGSPESAAPRVRAALIQRLADALRSPAREFVSLGRQLGWDIEAMVRAADGDGALVFRRIADLHGDGAPRAGLVAADASGRTLARGGDLDLLPRSRELECPVWPLHRTRGTAVIRAVVRLSGGEERPVAAVARPDGMAADMLVFAPDRPFAALPHLAVGTACRVCAHQACPQRRESSVVDT